MHVLANPISPDTLLSNFGLVGLAIILFAECGLLVGFFLPGDTILLAAGIALSLGTLHPLAAYLIVAPIAAIIGNMLGYWVGYRAGPAVFNRPDSRYFRPDYVTRAEKFFDRFGPVTVLLARFVAIVRTVVTVLAGTAKMRFSVYALWTVIGAILWADGVLLIGYALGHVDFVRAHKGWIDYAVIAVVVLSLIPAGIHYLQGRRRQRSPQHSS